MKKIRPTKSQVTMRKMSEKFVKECEKKKLSVIISLCDETQNGTCSIRGNRNVVGPMLTGLAERFLGNF